MMGKKNQKTNYKLGGGTISTPIIDKALISLLYKELP